MTDEHVDCEYCGESFKKQGLAAHQRYCDAKEAEEATAVPEYEGTEAKVVDRDDERCLRCESTAELVVHQIAPDRDVAINNLVTLCEGCEADLDGLHPRTKRTKIAET